MNFRSSVLKNPLVASTAFVMFGAAAVVAQSPAAKPAVSPAAKAAPAKDWRTPWGDPDLQGSWSNATTTPLERNAKYGNRAFLTEQERAESDKITVIATDKRDAPGTVDDLNGAYNGAWWERGLSDGRTSLIYDPSDGRIPPHTPEAEKRIVEDRRIADEREALASGPEDLPLYTRCVVRASLPRVSTGYDNNYEIIQTPGQVAIVQEQMHETRIIPLDGRPHLTPAVRQWLGDSRGRWEGKTLVVETTNFGDDISFEGSTRGMKLTERWTRVADDHIAYTFTVEDPATWTKPWSAAVTWNKTSVLYEYACNEDNFGMYGILAGARAEEKKAR